MKASSYSLSRAEWEALIYQWIFHERNRAIIVRSLLDGRTIEQLAEEFDISPQRAQAIVQECRKALQKQVEK